MQQDQWSGSITTTSREAVDALDAATLSLLAQRDDTGRLLAAAIAFDPGLVAAHATLGLLHLASGRRPRQAEAQRHLAAARTAFAQRGGTRREGALVAALGAWAERGDMWQAADILDEQLLAAPQDPLVLRLAYAIRFMLGDPVGMRFAAQRVLDAMPPQAPGRGYLRGCLAFALGETGERRRAEAEGRLALAEAPDDLWGAHAVAHVMEEGGRAREGLAWLDGAGRAATVAAAFGRHLVWHRALFHLHLGQGEAALHLYDTEVWREPGTDFRDFANAASLLWRLGSQGVEVGAARWAALADEAEQRLGEHCLAFADLHHAVALGAAGRRGAAARLIRGMRLRAAEQADSQAEVMERVGLAVVRGVVGALLGEPVEAAALLRAHRHDVQGLGGSNAQRDLVHRIGVDAALAAQQANAAECALAERAVSRISGAWEAMRLERIAALRRRAARRGRSGAVAHHAGMPALLHVSFA
jgi:tetratricopeptide (TPR) repeat protein